MDTVSISLLWEQRRQHDKYCTLTYLVFVRVLVVSLTTQTTEHVSPSLFSDPN